MTSPDRFRDMSARQVGDLTFDGGTRGSRRQRRRWPGSIGRAPVHERSRRGGTDGGGGGGGGAPAGACHSSERRDPEPMTSARAAAIAASCSSCLAPLAGAGRRAPPLSSGVPQPPPPSQTHARPLAANLTGAARRPPLQLAPAQAAAAILQDTTSARRT